MNRVFETLFKFVNKYFILIAIVQVIIFNIYFFTITRHEEYFTENWIEFSMLGGDPRKTSATYNEVIMDSITVKKIYVDADRVMQDINAINFGSKFKPYLDDIKEIAGRIPVKVMESPDWSNLFRKWIRRS